MLQRKGFTQRTHNEDSTLFTLDKLPSIDTSRNIGVYVRQSHRDADDKNGESRKTQLELAKFAQFLAGDSRAKVIIYDEKAGKSGQKRIDERPELDRLYSDISRNIVGIVIVSREDRLFRDKHGSQSGTFTEKAEKMKTVVIVPPLGPNGRLLYYDFSDYEHLRKFQDKMRSAYDYIATHVAYMNLNQYNKNARGCFDGRSLPPGLVIPLAAEKMEQRPVVYQPWAEKMQWVYARWKEYNYSVPKITREIERLPYLFPAPTEADYGLYMFKTTLTRVPGGYKPVSAMTIRRWFQNVHLIGWWPVSEESGEVIVDNHDAIIDRATFEEGYMHLTGYNLEGEPVPHMHNAKKIQVRRERISPPVALLHGNPNFSSPIADSITVSDIGEPNIDKYMGRVRKEHSIYKDNVFSIPCSYIDSAIVERLEALSLADKQLAEKIQKSLEMVQKAQAGECISIDDQLRNIEELLKRARTRLTRLEALFDDDKDKDSYEEDDSEGVLEDLVGKIKDLTVQKRQLQEKRKRLATIDGSSDIQKFYGVLSNFKERWPKLTLEQKQQLISLLTSKIEMEPVTTHWIKLTIHWIGPVCLRPDVALIWRVYGVKGPIIQDWERDIIRAEFATCTDRTALLQKLPNRTWLSLFIAARRMGIHREPEAARTYLDLHKSATWEDATVIPDRERAIAMIREAVKACEKGKRDTYPIWFVDANAAAHAQAASEAASYADVNLHTSGGPDNAA